MSVNLSCLISCDLDAQQILNLPESLAIASKNLFPGYWQWDEFPSPPELTEESLENLINDKGLWITGPKALTAAPSRRSIEIGHGWKYTRLFCQEDNDSIEAYIEFCKRFAILMGCKALFFAPDTLTESSKYQQVEERIQRGELTVADIKSRLSEYLDHNIYCLHITDS